VRVRDEHDRLICAECGRPIGGLTGLDELHNLQAHVAEHHDRSLDVGQALELRAQWEARDER